MPAWLSPRAWGRRLARLWRSSLQLRTILATVSLSAIAALGVGAAINVSVSSSLFDARRDQLLTLSTNATIAAQRVFDSTPGEEAEIDSILNEVIRTIQSAVATPGGTAYAIQLIPGQSVSEFSANANSPGLDLAAVVSPELRQSLVADGEDRVHWQSIGLIRAGAVVPGIVTASPLEIQGARYALYLVYDIRDAQDTLAVVRLALSLGGLALIVLIGAVTWVVVRLVIGPVQRAALTSQRLAAGELDVRLPVRGDDVLATLARSFNGMAASLRGQIKELAELSTVQQRFVSDVSHELRTPLTTIRLAGDLLYDRREEFAPETARTVELLHAQVERFEGLLADLLEMSRFDAGAAGLELEPVNAVRLAEQVMSSMSALAAAKGSALVLVAPGGFIEAELDPRRLRRVLSNLLGNAIDHGEGRDIEIWVDSDADAIALAVRDFGIGISAEQLGRVFDRFWRADPSRQRTTGGSGLGLAISLEDAVLHGGWLEAWSEPGAGSCFRLTLPRHPGTRLTKSPLGLPPERAPHEPSESEYVTQTAPVPGVGPSSPSPREEPSR